MSVIANREQALPPAQHEAIAAATKRLIQADRSRVPCPPVRELIGSGDTRAAYAVQRGVINERLDRGARVVGRKIGLTSPAVQEQLGVAQPDFGVLLDDMEATQSTVPLARLLQPRVEAEIAFVLAEDLADGPLDDEQIRASIAHAMAALEIVDSRIAGWDITFADTVADNASSGLFVLGTERRTLAEFTPVEAQMRMLADGTEVSRGDGAACLGDPLNALGWLARIARDFGDPLRAGQVILSGALGPMHSVTGESSVRAEISGLGTVATTFQKEHR